MIMRKRWDESALLAVILSDFMKDYIKEDVLPPDYKYQPLNNAQECLLALLEAGELLGLSSGDMEKIFYGNAVALFT